MDAGSCQEGTPPYKCSETVSWLHLEKLVEQEKRSSKEIRREGVNTENNPSLKGCHLFWGQQKPGVVGVLSLEGTGPCSTLLS